LTNNEFKTAVDNLWARTKSGELSDRKARFHAIEDLTERYFAVNGKHPEGGQLDRLATLCLYEEVTDKNEHKIAHNEYPIMSDRQLERRNDDEVSFTAASSIGTDMRDYRKPTRKFSAK
jgi:hypothetical protein